MNLIKLRIILHLARKQWRAVLGQAALLIVCLGALALFGSATVYIVQHHTGSSLVLGVLWCTMLELCFGLGAISVISQWPYRIDRALTPLAEQKWAWPQDYFESNFVTKYRQPQLF